MRQGPSARQRGQPDQRLSDGLRGHIWATQLTGPNSPLPLTVTLGGIHLSCLFPMAPSVGIPGDRRKRVREREAEQRARVGAGRLLTSLRGDNGRAKEKQEFAHSPTEGR